MSDEMDLTSYPSSSNEQSLALGLKIAAAILPFGSGPASLLVSTLFPEVGKVQIAWFESLGEAILALRQRVETHNTRLNAHEGHLQTLQQALDEFVQRPEFVAAVLRTTDIAVRDPLRKRWEALCNIVLNNMRPYPPDDALQLMFIGNLASFGEWHLYLLKFFDTPRGWQLNANGGEVGLSHRTVEPFNIIANDIPELAVRQEFCEQCIADLDAKGLISLDADKLSADDPNFPPLPLSFFDRLGRGPRPQLFRLTTALGQQFLQFIASPDSGADNVARNEE